MGASLSWTRSSVFGDDKAAAAELKDRIERDRLRDRVDIEAGFDPKFKLPVYAVGRVERNLYIKEPRLKIPYGGLNTTCQFLLLYMAIRTETGEIRQSVKRNRPLGLFQFPLAALEKAAGV
jgi:hypothetical protein